MLINAYSYSLENFLYAKEEAFYKQGMFLTLDLAFYSSSFFQPSLLLLLFQWVYVGKHGGSDLIPIRPILDLNIIEHRCKFEHVATFKVYKDCNASNPIEATKSQDLISCIIQI